MAEIVGLGVQQVALATGAPGAPAVAITTATPLATAPVPSTDTSRILTAAATTNPTIAKNSAGTLRQITGYNAAAYPVYLKTHNTNVAPVAGTTPVRHTFMLPSLTGFSLDRNDYFPTGIAYTLTKGIADNDTTVLVAGDIVALNVDYL
jgi:hypothetical protein